MCCWDIKFAIPPEEGSGSLLWPIGPGPLLELAGTNIALGKTGNRVCPARANLAKPMGLTPLVGDGCKKPRVDKSSMISLTELMSFLSEGSGRRTYFGWLATQLARGLQIEVTRPR